MYSNLPSFPIHMLRILRRAGGVTILHVRWPPGRVGRQGFVGGVLLGAAVVLQLDVAGGDVGALGGAAPLVGRDAGEDEEGEGEDTK